MALSIGFGKSGSSSTYSENIAPQQIPYLSNIWGSGEDLFNMSSGYAPSLMTGGVDIMGSTIGGVNPYWQSAMAGGVYGGIPTAQNYNAAFQNLLSPTSYARDLYGDIMGGQGNDYVGALGAGISDIYGQLADKSLAKLDQRAGMMSGSSPWENATADILSESDRNLGMTLANLGYETFDKDLNLKLDIARMADQNWLTSATGAMDAASQGLAAEQATRFGGLDFAGDLYTAGMSQYMLPWQPYMNYAMMNQPIVLGTGGSSSKSTGFGFGL